MTKDVSTTVSTDYSTYIATSRYARYLENEGRRETWEETVDRYMNFFFTDKDYFVSCADATVIEDAIKNLEIMPSMRSLMTAGEALNRDEVAGYNCAYTTIESPRDFDEAMYILMCGTGVGFSVERKYISKLPVIAEEFHNTDTVINVADSKIGWAKSLREIIAMLYVGQIPKWDTSKVRPSGARLKTFGGRASGPQPLEDLFNFVVSLFQTAKGRQLSSIECHDIMCKIGDIVVVGGVRRSAMISLSDLGDTDMRHAKYGAWYETAPHRALANNSVCYENKPSMTDYMKEWRNLYDSKSGERGIFNRAAAQHHILQHLGERRDSGIAYGTNPCCFTGDMRLLTSEGYFRLDDLEEDHSVNIINHTGEVTEGKVWCSGEKETIEVRFHGDKNSIVCTSDHRFMLTTGSETIACDLVGKRPMPYFRIKDKFTVDDSDAFLAGFIQGDGNATRLNSPKHLGLEVNFGEKDGDIAEMYTQEVGKWYSREAKRVAERYCIKPVVLPERSLPAQICNPYSFSFEEEYSTDFLSGLFSANGCVIKGYRVALKSTCRTLVDQVKQFLMMSHGIDSYITTNKSKKVMFSNGEYTCKQSYDLNIGRVESILKFAENISFGQAYKRKALKELILLKAPKVSAIHSMGLNKVYDFNEPSTSWGVVEGCVVHNSEIVLRPQQFCNLSEVVVRSSDTLDSLKRKVRLATIIGTIQSTQTNFRYLRKKWKDNCEEERLLGVSLTGIMDHPVLSNKTTWAKGYLTFCPIEEGRTTEVHDLGQVLNALKEVAIETNKEWAAKLGISPSAAITCVKPSGTVSQLVNSSSGIHPRHSSYYIRTVRTDKKDPLYNFLQENGVPVEDAIGKELSTAIFSFPIKAPEGSITREQISAIDQLELWKIYAEHWCEHKPSITVYVREDEWMEVGAWVYKHFDIMSGVSFLPYDGGNYKQAPYQEITKEEYEEAVKKFPKIDWESFAEEEDNTTSSQELACSGNSCEVV